VEEDGVLQGDAALSEEERAGREAVHDEKACAGAAGAMGMPSFIIYCMHVTGLPYLIPRHTLSSII